MSRLLVLTLGLFLFAGFSAPAASAAPITIFLDFDGDAGFPEYGFPGFNGLTSVTTSPLPAFDLSGYGLTVAETNTVATNITSLFTDRFSPWQVNITTTMPGSGDFMTVGLGGDQETFDRDFVGDTRTLFGIAQNVDAGDLIQNDFARVFGGSFGLFAEFQGLNATVARLSTAIGLTAIHEAGHNLGVFHSYAWDTYVFPGNPGDNLWNSGGVPLEPGELGGAEFASDSPNLHIMATGSSGLTLEERATVDRQWSTTSVAYLDTVLMPIPEPATVTLLFVAVAGVGIARRRRKAA